MKRNLLPLSFFLFAVLSASSLFAQDWVKMMQDPTVNFFDVQKAYNQYAAVAERKMEREARKARRDNGEVLNEKEGETEVPGSEIYKRWEWYMAPRVSMTGERFDPAGSWKAMVEYRKGIQTAGIGGAGSWTFLGPSNTSGIVGAGRINTIRIHPTTPSTIYACVPNSGFWISIDGGTTWTTNTDQLPQAIGCTDVAFDPTNPDIMYLATGDAEGGDCNSVGILKSTDGAKTWATTGLSFNLPQYRTISRVIVDPTNKDIIYACTSNGIYKSTDASATFTQVLQGTFKSMELKPGTPNTIYACGTEFQYSTNGGTTWTKATGFPASSTLCRMTLAVSAKNPLIVYVNAGKVGPTFGEDGFYKSTNSGVAFTKVSTPTNFGNQEWYDLPVAASPTDDKEVMIGGQTTFLKSTNAGASWSQIAQSTHVDYHGITYDPNGTTVYIASDGGVYKSTDGGAGWTTLNNNLAISMMYGFGQSTTNSQLLIQGWQDNGTNLLKNGSWNGVMGGDGMLAFISWGNDQNMWGSQFNGSMNRSTNGGASFSACGKPGSEACPWVTEWSENPTTANTIHVGCANVWTSTNGGATFTKPGNVAGTSTVQITALTVSPVDSKVMWTAKGGSLYKSIDAGVTWVVNATFPSGNIKDIKCHPKDINKVWVCYSGFSAKLKVYKTIDGGSTWTNISGSLPNVPMTCMEIDKNANDGVYLGTDVGVFYRDATMSVWQPFFNGLPNTTVTQLSIFYGTPIKIRASTYGRGMWESTLYQPGAYPPDANFLADKNIGCPGLGVQYTDYSPGSPTAWNWTFQGGSPSTSSSQNPFVAYNTPGTYSVSLTVTSANGSDTQINKGYIIVSNSTNAAPVGLGKKFCGSTSLTLSVTPSAPGTVRWWDKEAAGNVVGSGNSFTTPVLSGDSVYTYYVDEAFTGGNVDFVGLNDNVGNAGSIFSANDIRGLYFDVNTPVIIQSVDIYPQTAGKRTIEILDDNGNLVTDTTLTVISSPSTAVTVTINRAVYPGKNYFIKFRGMVDCFRNTAGAVYPYEASTTPSPIVITNSNAGTPGYYYFFYNWKFQNIVCNTGRTPIILRDTCFVIGVNDLFVNKKIDIYPNPNTGLFNASFTVENSDNYRVKINNNLGQLVYEEKLENFVGVYSKKIDISSFQKGVYFMSVSNSKNETVKKVIVY